MVDFCVLLTLFLVLELGWLCHEQIEIPAIKGTMTKGGGWARYALN